MKKLTKFEILKARRASFRIAGLHYRPCEPMHAITSRNGAVIPWRNLIVLMPRINYNYVQQPEKPKQIQTPAEKSRHDERAPRPSR